MYSTSFAKPAIRQILSGKLCQVIRHLDITAHKRKPLSVRKSTDNSGRSANHCAPAIAPASMRFFA
jgi:hypothetical protein